MVKGLSLAECMSGTPHTCVACSERNSDSEHIVYNTEREGERETDRQTDRQTETDGQRDTERHTERERHIQRDTQRK